MNYFSEYKDYLVYNKEDLNQENFYTVQAGIVLVFVISYLVFRFFSRSQNLEYNRHLRNKIRLKSDIRNQESSISEAEEGQ